MKIIDMTGREQKVHHGYGALSQIGISGKALSELKNAKYDLPELVKNLDILVNMTEDKIILSEKKYVGSFFYFLLCMQLVAFGLHGNQLLW